MLGEEDDVGKAGLQSLIKNICHLTSVALMSDGLRGDYEAGINRKRCHKSRHSAFM